MSWHITCSRNIFLSLRDKSKVFHVRLDHELKRYSYTVLEAQNFPNLDSLDVESPIPEFEWVIHNGLRRTTCSDKQEISISQHRRWNGYLWSFLTKIDLKNPSFLYRKLQKDLHYFGRNNSDLMYFVTLVNIFNCYGSIVIFIVPYEQKT